MALKRALKTATSGLASVVSTGIFASVGSRLTNYLQERDPAIEVKLYGGTMVEQ